MGSEVPNKQILTSAAGVQMSAIVGLLTLPGGSPLWLLSVLVLKFAGPVFFQTTNLVKGEMFPAQVRVTALSISGACGRVGAFTAPALIEFTRGEPGRADEFSTFLTCVL